MIGIALRLGGAIEDIVDELVNINCPQVNMFAKSCPDAVASVLKDSIRRDGGMADAADLNSARDIPFAGSNPVPDTIVESFKGRTAGFEPANLGSIPSLTTRGTPCPECGTRMNMEEGCETCRNCGYSKCS